MTEERIGYNVTMDLLQAEAERDRAAHPESGNYLAPGQIGPAMTAIAERVALGGHYSRRQQEEDLMLLVDKLREALDAQRERAETLTAAIVELERRFPAAVADARRQSETVERACTLIFAGEDD